MSCEKSLVVRGIPADWTADDIELFFDDDSRCPDGRVENAELTTGEGTVSATVTFDNAHGNYSVHLTSFQILGFRPPCIMMSAEYIEKCFYLITSLIFTAKYLVNAVELLYIVHFV